MIKQTTTEMPMNKKTIIVMTFKITTTITKKNITTRALTTLSYITMIST